MFTSIDVVNLKIILKIKITCLGPQSVNRDVCSLEFFCHAEDTHAHAILGHRVGYVIAEPSKVEEKNRSHYVCNNLVLK